MAGAARRLASATATRTVGAFLFVIALWIAGLVLTVTTGAGWWIGAACAAATVVVIVLGNT